MKAKLKDRELLPASTIREEKMHSIFYEIRELAKTEQEEMNIWGELLNLTREEENDLFASDDRKAAYLTMKNKATIKLKEQEMAVPVRIIQ